MHWTEKNGIFFTFRATSPEDVFFTIFGTCQAEEGSDHHFTPPPKGGVGPPSTYLNTGGLFSILRSFECFGVFHTKRKKIFQKMNLEFILKKPGVSQQFRSGIRSFDCPQNLKFPGLFQFRGRSGGVRTLPTCQGVQAKGSTPANLFPSRSLG